MITPPVMQPILYLSPHPDDVVFSCGGSLALDCASGPVTLVTAFTRPAQAAARLAEDRSAAELLGCRHVNLDLPAALDRPEVRGALDVYAPLGPQHLGVISELVARLRPLLVEQPLLYAPLGVGGHSDHRLCFVAARALAESLGLTLRLYEDQPFSQAPYAVARRLALLRARAVASDPAPPAAATDAVGQAAQQRFLSSLPGLLPAGLLRSLRARRLARAQWHHDRPSTLAGAPPVLQARTRAVDAVAGVHMEAIAAYASQWPRFAASPQALYADLVRHGGSATLVERCWEALPTAGGGKPLGAALVT